MEQTTHSLPPHVLEALSRVIEHFWDGEQKDFHACLRWSTKKHIYQALTILARWQQNPSGNPDYFGDCPECKHGCNDGYLNIGRDHWMVCHIHRLKWCIGDNLFGSWREESKDDWEENHRLIADYKEIPIPMDPEKFR